MTEDCNKQWFTSARNYSCDWNNGAFLFFRQKEENEEDEKTTTKQHKLSVKEGKREESTE